MNFYEFLTIIQLLLKVMELVAIKAFRIIVIQQLTPLVFAQTLLIAQDFYGDFSSAESWYLRTSPQTFTTFCGSTKLFGGFQSFDNTQFIAKMFELPPHYQVAIKFSFWRIDQWDSNDHFIVYSDNIQIHNDIYSNLDSSTNLCGDILKSDFSHQIEKVFSHSSTTVQIFMTSTNGGWWGISEFRMQVEQCPLGCNSCNKFGCFKQILQIGLFTKRIFNTIPDQEGWLFDTTIATTRNQCLDFYYLTSPGNQLSKSIQLDNHIAISLQLKAITFNSISSKFRILIDDNLVQLHSLRNSNSQLYIRIKIGECSQLVNRLISIEKNNSILSIYTSLHFCLVTIICQINVFQLEHTNNIIKIDIMVEYQGIAFSDHNQKFGIRDFQLFVVPTRSFDFCTDYSLYQSDGCFPQLYYFVEGCKNYIKGFCVECQDGWENINQSKNCVPLCGDLKINLFEECDDGNNIPFDGCHKCKFSCPQDCLVCQFGRCLKCKLPKELINNKCIDLTFSFGEIKLDEDSFNQLINSLEQDNYQIQNYLYQNQPMKFIFKGKNTDFLSYNDLKEYNNHPSHLKIQNCFEQLYDYCVKCQVYFQVSFNKKYCTPQCNDGITVLNEICDDQNNIQFDGCYKCEKSCQLECLICVNTKCQVCQEGWELLDNQCYQICGDNKLAQLSNEQCDDGNFYPNDGCYECKFECDQYCHSCVTTYECFLCQDYFENINGICRPICGDGHVVFGLEECEDQNQEQFDGCYQCQFQCNEKCEKCNQGKCILCQEGYIIQDDQRCQATQESLQDYIDQEEKEQEQTQNSCGDQIKQIEEDCDDGNQLSNDGCSEQCQIEKNWHCDEKMPNRCYSYTSFILMFLNQTYDKIFIQMSFTQRVRWNGSLSNFQKQFQLESWVQMEPNTTSQLILYNQNILINYNLN